MNTISIIEVDGTYIISIFSHKGYKISETTTDIYAIVHIIADALHKAGHNNTSKTYKHNTHYIGSKKYWKDTGH